MPTQSDDLAAGSKAPTVVDVSRRSLLRGVTTGGVAAVSIAATASLSSGRAEASDTVASLADLSAAIAALPSWGGYLRLAPGQYTMTAPLWVQNVSGLTLNLEGCNFASPATFTIAPQMYWSAMLMLQSCTDVKVVGGLFDSRGQLNGGLGFTFCTDYTAQGVIAQNAAFGFGQLASIGGLRGQWIDCKSRNSRGSARGFWLGGASNANQLETDLLVSNCEARSNAATGLSVQAASARIISGLYCNNQGAGIASAASAASSSSKQTVMGTVCTGNLFPGWGTDVWNGTTVSDMTVVGNIFTGNAHGQSATINRCNGFIYSDNIEDGIVQVIASSNGKVRLSPGATLATNGPANTNVTIG